MLALLQVLETDNVVTRQNVLLHQRVDPSAWIRRSL